MLAAQTLPSLVRLHPAAISVKRGLEGGAAEPAAKRRSTLYESVGSKTAYRGQSGRNALDKCLKGGHFSWLEETAFDSATLNEENPGYVIETTPLGMHLEGAVLSHGAQWATFYDTFRTDKAEQPAHWEAMLKLVEEWKQAIDLGETTDPDAPHIPTEDGFVATLHWKRPSATQKELLQRLGSPQGVLRWAGAKAAVLQDWKEAVYAAIQAAPWHIDQGEWTSEFFVDGVHLGACVDKVTEYVYQHTSREFSTEVVYERTPNASNKQAGEEFDQWYKDTAPTLVSGYY